MIPCLMVYTTHKNGDFGDGKHGIVLPTLDGWNWMARLSTRWATMRTSPSTKIGSGASVGATFGGETPIETGPVIKVNWEKYGDL